MNNEHSVSNNLTLPNEQTILNNLGKVAYMLDKTYLSCLKKDYGVLPFDETYNSTIEIKVTYASNIRALRVKRCVINKEERVIDCFKNILSLFCNSEDTLALIFKRTPDKVEIFFAVKNIGSGRNSDSIRNIELLEASIRGNFPGTDVEIIKSEITPEDNDDITPTSKTLNLIDAKAISVLSNIPSEKSEDFICQGIEKLLNGIVPKNDDESYTVVFLAEAIPILEIRSILSGYEELATALTPYAGYQFQLGENKSVTEGEMESLSHSKGISHAISRTHSVSTGVNGSQFSSTTESLSNTQSDSKSFGLSLLKGLLYIGKNMVKSVTETVAKTVGSSIGLSEGYGYSWGTTDTKSETDTSTKGTNHSISLGTSKNTTYTYKSYLVNDLLEKLEASIKRVNESKANGLWKYATYVLSSKIEMSENVANFIRSISQGDKSYIETSFIQSWRYEGSNNKTEFNEILKYVNHLCHPVFGNFIENKSGFPVIPVTPAANVSTSELANIFAFPRTSVQSLPVIECVRFGREPHSLTGLIKDIKIGCAYHMHHIERNNPVMLSKNELTKHTFITGSTGSGKSNTIYTMLGKLCPEKDEKTTFLVIEPAKGEYKDLFGGRSDVTVYGTNLFKFPNLLRINPFSFPADVHVLEHIDRLVEVFNACWPMYAAMPAILKEAVEKSYELTGWGLKYSKNPGKFPTFDTLMDMLPKVIDSSAYSADTSNDYKGALLTRVRSLTTGIQGQIFGADIEDKELFNKNVIVDISRIGSPETKALIMGVLILKLQEFRMSEPKRADGKLRHITVLEEAHNILRRTSNEQSQESSNLQGKSVEMLANAIAEMRAYGEGFIIADQSPGLMDMSVIRNTNTKIIMRLPDESDRMLAGKAAGLSDMQIGEISRFEVGVAAVSQSGWLEPVLSKIDKFDDEKPLSDRYIKEYKNVPYKFEWNDNESPAIKQFFNTAFGVEKPDLSAETIDTIRRWSKSFKVSNKVRIVIEHILEGEDISDKQQMILIGGLFIEKIRFISDREKAISKVKEAMINQYNFTEQDEVIRCINKVFVKYFPVNLFINSKNMNKAEGAYFD